MKLSFSTPSIKVTNALLSFTLLVTVPFVSNNVFSATKADTNFYGRIHLRLVAINNQDASLNNAGHRLGVKGEGVLNNGWDFFYKLESEINNDDGLGKKDGTGGHTLSTPSAVSDTDLADITIRQAHAGLSNNFGSITFGRQNNPLSNTYTADVFETNSGSFEQTPFRLGHSIVLQTPSDHKIRGYLGAMLEGGGDEEENEQLDGYVVGGQYSIQQLVLHLGFFHADFNALNTDKSEFSDASFGLSYRVNNFYFAANAEQSILKATDGTEKTTDVIDLGITYTANTVIYGSGYAVQDNGTDKRERFLIGAYVNLGGSNDCYIELGLLNKAAGDRDNLTIGYRISF